MKYNDYVKEYRLFLVEMWRDSGQFQFVKYDDFCKSMYDIFLSEVA